jgi:hypothetical protein
VNTQPGLASTAAPNFMERWKPISGYEGHYEVSDRGRVRSVGRKVLAENGSGLHLHAVNERILKLSVNDKGYLRVGLCRDGVQRRFRVNRLVAIAFIPNPLGLPEVNHKKGVEKSNNAVGNLEWATRGTNMWHASTTGLLPKGLKFNQGSKHGMSKLTEAQVIKIRSLYKGRGLGPSQPAIGRMFGVTHHAVRDICSGKNWKHLEAS